MIKNRKIRFNFVDFLIFLIIAAAAALVVVVFAGSFGKNTGEAKSQPAVIEYVVELKGIDNNAAMDWAVGTTVENSVTRESFGELRAISKSDSQQAGFDYTTGQETYSVMEGKSNYLLTIRAEAEETEDSFLVNDYEIRVGTQLSMHFPGFVCSGYCIGITKLN